MKVNDRHCLFAIASRTLIFFGAFRIFHVHRQLLLVAFISQDCQVMVFVNKIFSILSLHQISQNKALIKSSDVHGLYACASPLMHSPVFVDAASILMFTPRNSPHFFSSPSPKLFSVFFSRFFSTVSCICIVCLPLCFGLKHSNEN